MRAEIFELHRDENDREAWKLVHVKEGEGFWNPYAALRHYLEGEDDVPAGTYKCVSGTATATTGWNGERIT